MSEPSSEDWRQEALDALHTSPTRKEWLVNALLEIDREISELLRKKVEYEGEFEEILKKERT